MEAAVLSRLKSGICHSCHLPSSGSSATSLSLIVQPILVSEINTTETNGLLPHQSKNLLPRKQFMYCLILLL